MTLPPEIVAFQKSFSEKHPEFIQAAHRLMETCNKILADSTSLLQESQVMCRCLAQTVANSFVSMNLLTSHGRGCDALKIVRSMFESAVVLASFDHFSELIQDFMDFRWIQAMKSIRQAADTPRAKLIPPEIEREIKKQYDRVLPQFSDRRGQPRRSWYGGSFKNLCERLDKASVKMPWAVAQYPDLYATSSGLMHGDVGGLESQVDSSGFNVEIPPADVYIKEAIMSGHWALFMALASYASIAKLTLAQTYVDRMFKDWEAVWGEGSRELDLAKKDFEW